MPRKARVRQLRNQTILCAVAAIALAGAALALIATGVMLPLVGIAAIAAGSALFGIAAIVRMVQLIRFNQQHSAREPSGYTSDLEGASSDEEAEGNARDVTARRVPGPGEILATVDAEAAKAPAPGRRERRHRARPRRRRHPRPDAELVAGFTDISRAHFTKLVAPPAEGEGGGLLGGLGSNPRMRYKRLIDQQQALRDMHEEYTEFLRVQREIEAYEDENPEPKAEVASAPATLPAPGGIPPPPPPPPPPVAGGAGAPRRAGRAAVRRRREFRMSRVGALVAQGNGNAFRRYNANREQRKPLLESLSRTLFGTADVFNRHEEAHIAFLMNKRAVRAFLTELDAHLEELGEGLRGELREEARANRQRAGRGHAGRGESRVVRDYKKRWTDIRSVNGKRNGLVRDAAAKAQALEQMRKQWDRMAKRRKAGQTVVGAGKIEQEQVTILENLERLQRQHAERTAELDGLLRAFYKEELGMDYNEESLLDAEPLYLARLERLRAAPAAPEEAGGDDLLAVLGRGLDARRGAVGDEGDAAKEARPGSPGSEGDLFEQRFPDEPWWTDSTVWR